MTDKDPRESPDPVLSSSHLRALAPAVLGVAVAVSGCAGQDAGAVGSGGDTHYVSAEGQQKVKTVPPADRTAAPDVSGTTLDGKKLRLSSYRGKVVVLNFWASWCAPCRAEAPTLREIYKKTRAQGVRFVGVNIKDGKAAAQAFDRNLGIDYPSIYDQPGEVALQFRSTVPPTAIPSTIVIDRKGRIAARIIGEVEYTQLNPIVTKVSGERS